MSSIATRSTSTAGPIQLKLDIFRPLGDTATSRPAVVWMHGGFFTGGDKSNMWDQARAVAERGYVGVSLQYRLRPLGKQLARHVPRQPRRL